MTLFCKSDRHLLVASSPAAHDIEEFGHGQKRHDIILRVILQGIPELWSWPKKAMTKILQELESWPKKAIWKSRGSGWAMKCVQVDAFMQAPVDSGFKLDELYLLRIESLHGCIDKQR